MFEGENLPFIGPIAQMEKTKALRLSFVISEIVPGEFATMHEPNTALKYCQQETFSLI
jgi:hypothetical protein